MNKVVEFLNANSVQYLATVGRDGKAKCRPFMFAGELDGMLVSIPPKYSVSQIMGYLKGKSSLNVSNTRTVQ